MTEDTTYEDILVSITWKIRQFNVYLNQFNASIDEIVNKKGKGKRRMERMVNGGSAPIRKKVLDDLRRTTPDLVDKVIKPKE